MKSDLDLARIASIFSTLALMSLLSGCGQKGPLFMPAKPTATTAPAVSAASSPATSATVSPSTPFSQ